MSDLKAAIEAVRRMFEYPVNADFVRASELGAEVQKSHVRTILAAAEREHNREIHIGTHGPGCWAWGWRHYACAEARIADLEKLVETLQNR